MLLRPRRSLVPVAQEQGLQVHWAWGSALPTQTTMATTMDSKPTCKFRAPRLLLCFHATGSEADSLRALDHQGAELHEYQVETAHVQFSTPS